MDHNCSCYNLVQPLDRTVQRPNGLVNLCLQHPSTNDPYLYRHLLGKYITISLLRCSNQIKIKQNILKNRCSHSNGCSQSSKQQMSCSAGSLTARIMISCHNHHTCGSIAAGIIKLLRSDTEILCYVIHVLIKSTLFSMPPTAAVYHERRLFHSHRDSTYPCSQSHSKHYQCLAGYGCSRGGFWM